MCAHEKHPLPEWFEGAESAFLGPSNFSSSKKHDYKSNDGEDEDDDDDGNVFYFYFFFLCTGDDY